MDLKAPKTCRVNQLPILAAEFDNSHNKIYGSQFFTSNNWEKSIVNYPELYSQFMFSVPCLLT